MSESKNESRNDTKVVNMEEINIKKKAHENISKLKMASDRIGYLESRNSEMREKLSIHESYMRIIERLDSRGMTCSDGGYSIRKELEIFAREIEDEFLAIKSPGENLSN